MEARLLQLILLMTQLTENASEGARLLQLILLMTQLRENASEGARLLQLILLMTQLSWKTSGALDWSQCFTAVTTDDTTHRECQ